MVRLDTGVPFWMRSIRDLGITTVLAFGFIWWLVTIYGPTEARIEQKLDHHELMRARDMQAMNAFLYAICLNTADDEVERARCAIALDGSLEQRK